MVARKPLVFDDDGNIVELGAADSLDAVVVAATTTARTNDNGSAISKGQAVYPNSSGNVDLAKGDSISTARVIGLVADTSIASSSSGNIQTGGVLTISDWSSVTGTVALTPDKTYFLSSSIDGRLSDTPPTGAGTVIVAVGIALSTTELLIEVGRPYIRS